ncbi:hypothetical protein ED733_000734 [Metarhizium rileyi]|uniref:Myb-like domain-containing protein n=1 Tax=Metarhizium rileyi (strain RCEF 4871) TaxID=1649241 RepID=A0A5C6FZK1_METRR|nr:hypothetical protein ED733_000734 [Metarhizium rileyi]
MPRKVVKKKQPGRHWTLEEERFFWETIIPESPKALGYIADKKSWKKCAELMTNQFELSHRVYTETALSAHFFINIHKEPAIPRLVKEQEEHHEEEK